jgi:hypothetical protein
MSIMIITVSNLRYRFKVPRGLYYDLIINCIPGTGHGSSAAGIVGGINTGVAPGVNIYGVKVLFDDKKGRVSTVAEGLDFVLSRRKLNSTRPMVVAFSVGTKCGANCATSALVKIIL